MRDEVLSQLMDRWESDDAFRTAVRNDPRTAIERAGFDLDADEWKAVEGFDWAQTDSQLEARVSKGVHQGGC
jgi:hypothetical protein